MTHKKYLTFAVLLALLCIWGAGAENKDAPPVKSPLATWGTYGLEICNTPGNTPQQNPKIVASADGNFLTAWEDGRYGYTRIYAQKIDGQGKKLWNEVGLSICGQGGNQNGYHTVHRPLIRS